MSYIWKNYKSNDRFEADEAPFSPYIEEGPRSLDGRRLINPIIRFDDIFSPIMSAVVQGVGSKEQWREVENILFHYLAQLDRKCGIHYFSVIEYFIERDLLQGKYGEWAKNAYENLSEKDKISVKHYLRKHIEANGKELFFRDAVQEIFPGSATYFFEEDDKRFIVYIPQLENKENVEALELLKYLFMEVTADVRVFWGYHFGIIGKNNTMRIGNIAIY